MNYYTYESLKIGQFEKFSILVTNEMMEKFYIITGDTNPLHNDKEFAKYQEYKDNVVYGMLTASFLSTLAGVYIPGKLSLIQSLNIDFVKPVYVGNKLTILGIVKELNDTVKQMTLKVEIYNENNEKILRGKMKVGFLNE